MFDWIWAGLCGHWDRQRKDVKSLCWSPFDLLVSHFTMIWTFQFGRFTKSLGFIWLPGWCSGSPQVVRLKNVETQRNLLRLRNQNTDLLKSTFLCLFDSHERQLGLPVGTCWHQYNRKESLPIYTILTHTGRPCFCTVTLLRLTSLQGKVSNTRQSQQCQHINLAWSASSWGPSRDYKSCTTERLRVVSILVTILIP